jgi:hypothetical protein
MSTDTTPVEDEMAAAVRTVLEDFVDELDTALDGDAQHIERILRGDDTLSRSDINAEPEEWTEDVLINPLINAAGLNKRPGRPNPKYDTPDWVSTEIPDFELEQPDEDGDNGSLWIIGENKSVNKFGDARSDMQAYLSKLWWPNYGIATDGIQWAAYRVESSKTGDGNGDAAENRDVAQHYRSFVETVDLRGAIRAIAEEKGVVAQHQLNGSDPDEEIRAFVDVFIPDALVDMLRRRAPKELRDKRKSDVDAFYELYIELLFGASDEYEDEYDSNLRADIIPPEDTAEQDADIFAVELVNRLLFVKFLEKRDVLDDGWLLERIRAYNDDLPNTLYKTVFDPVFYELMNTPKPDRPPHQRTGWQGKVPYLNGGLFRETVPDERQFDVSNRTLERVIRDLVEGTELDFEIDPAILGSVFERTINHLSGEKDRQKEIGAFYTPDDITTLINRDVIREKARDEILAAYADSVTQPAEFRDSVEGMPLEEILSKIESGASWFGRPDAIDDALDRLQNLRVLDPACGSGHFLTAALDELHTVQVSLLRGKHGDELSRRDRYEAKEDLVLGSVYGVDVDPVAVQIARLRSWLTLIDEGWSDDFGQLPNIELNIISGNSLIGLPAKQYGQTSAEAWTSRLDELITLRRAYKGLDVTDEDIAAVTDIDAETASEVTKDDIEEVLREIRPEFDAEYMNRLTHTFEDEVMTPSDFDAIVGDVAGDTLHPEIEAVKIQRGDGGALSDDDVERLEDIGCTTYKRSARFVVASRHNDLKDNGTQHAEVREEITSNLRGLLEDGFEFAAVERQPVASDLDNITGEAFHWPAEFPEVAATNGGNGSHDAEFDIVVGNPPYGDVLSDVEKGLLGTFITGGINDIVAQFVERELQLLDAGGYFGNITTLRLVYQSDIQEFHDALREMLTETEIACFGTRPSRIFDNADIKTAIFTGQKTAGEKTEDKYSDDACSTDADVDNGTDTSDNNDTDADDANDGIGVIRTSDAIIFSEADRDDKLSNIDYEATEGYVLRDTIGGDDGSRAILPKIGTEQKRDLLKALKTLDSDRVFDAVFSRDEDYGD